MKDGQNQVKEAGVAESLIDRENNFLDVDNFPQLKDIENGSIFSLSLSNKTSSSTHGIHRFAAKYIPQIPKWAINEFCNENSVVLDPFMGSGTTLVEASGFVKHSYGIDIDPLARLIASVKTSPINLDEISLHYSEIDNSFDKKTSQLIAPMNDIQNFDHWFTNKNWSDLQSLLSTILQLECSAKVRDFYICVFSSIVRTVSNADDQSHKTYVSGTLKKQPIAVKEIFMKRLEKAADAVSELSNIQTDGAVCDILKGDAQCINLEGGTVDLIVTSPPYLDSVDYMYNFMLEYFWLGEYLGIESRREFNLTRRKTTGTKNPLLNDAKVPDIINDLINLEQIPKYRKKAVPAYFQDMQKHFKEASRVLKEGGRYVLVVGNSQTEAGAIPVHDCLIRLAHENGLSLECAFGYRIRRHYMKFPRKGRGGIILIDWVIVLKKGLKTNFPKPLPMPTILLGENDVAH